MRQSHLFTKTIREIPKDETSVNAQLLIRAGFIDKLMAGAYSFLPLGLRVLKKIENIIREEMQNIGGQEVLLPALQPKENWQKTQRWDVFDALFKLKGREEKEYALGATHEEILTPLVKKFLFSYKDLPLYIYQIQNKFRDEPRAKSGLLRGREFLMKDLYSFHKDENDLYDYYEKAANAYWKIFERCGIGDKTYFTLASGGTFSKYSHEFQTIAPSGEDTIFICQKCDQAINKEIKPEIKECPACGEKNFIEEKAIEVGNIFNLGKRYSEPFDLKFRDQKGEIKPVIMGCYGLGISRLMGAIVEVYHDDKGIIWPAEVAPFSFHLVPVEASPKVKKISEEIYKKLLKENAEILYDDRKDKTAGEKFVDADLLGIPKRIVVSEKTLAKNCVEIKKRDEKEFILVSVSRVKNEIN